MSGSGATSKILFDQNLSSRAPQGHHLALPGRREACCLNLSADQHAERFQDEPGDVLAGFDDGLAECLKQKILPVTDGADDRCWC